MHCHVAGEESRQHRLTGGLNTGLLVRPHARHVSCTTFCFWHLTNLFEWTYLPKITLATRYLVSVPTHFPSNMEITYPTCLAFTDVLKGETYLLQINLSFCFGRRDQSADLVGFGAYNIGGEAEKTGFVWSQEEKVKGDLMVFFICIRGTFKEDRAKLLEVQSERKEAIDMVCSQGNSSWMLGIFFSLWERSQTGTGTQGVQGVSILEDVQNPTGCSPEQPKLSLKLDLTSKLDLL